MLLENYKYLTAEMRCDELFKRNLELKSLLGEEVVEREVDKNLIREATRKSSLDEKTDGRAGVTETAPREENRQKNDDDDGLDNRQEKKAAVPEETNKE